MKRYALLFAAAASACDSDPEAATEPVPAETPAAVVAAALPTVRASEKPDAAVAPIRQPLVAERLILAEWSKAENKAVCAPVSFVSDGGKGGTPRRANFSGGWAVAFDLPGKRSAYGVAGAGLIPADDDAEIARRERLINQWPSFRDLPALPQPSYAGYGVEGAQPWSDDDPQALRSNALAYVRVGGQTCQYNVWSRLGRAHLETLLENLSVLGRVLR